MSEPGAPGVEPGTTPPPAGGGEPAAPAPVAAEPASWYAGMGDEHRGFVEVKGWKNPEAAIDSYRNLEKLIGAPPESVIKLPKEMTPEAFREIAGRLGAPDSADKYQLEIPDGEQDFANFMRETAFRNGLTQTQAADLSKSLLEMTAGYEKTAAEDRQAKNTEEKSALLKEWGAAYDQNLGVAKQAVREFGLTPEMAEAFEQVLGFKATHEFFHKIGSKIGEAQYKDGSNVGINGALSPAAAQHELNTLMNDASFKEAWADSGHPGHKAALERKTRLTEMAYPS